MRGRVWHGRSIKNVRYTPRNEQQPLPSRCLHRGGQRRSGHKHSVAVHLAKPLHPSQGRPAPTRSPAHQSQSIDARRSEPPASTWALESVACVAATPNTPLMQLTLHPQRFPGRHRIRVGPLSRECGRTLSPTSAPSKTVLRILGTRCHAADEHNSSAHRPTFVMRHKRVGTQQWRPALPWALRQGG